MLGIALDLGDPAVLDVGQHAALPETELTEGGHDLVTLGAGIVRPVRVQPPPLRREPRTHRRRTSGSGTDLDEIASG